MCPSRAIWLSMDNYRAELADTKIKLSVLVWYKADIIQSTWPGNKYNMSRVDPSRNTQRDQLSTLRWRGQIRFQLQLSTLFNKLRRSRLRYRSINYLQTIIIKWQKLEMFRKSDKYEFGIRVNAITNYYLPFKITLYTCRHNAKLGMSSIITFRLSKRDEGYHAVMMKRTVRHTCVVSSKQTELT
jgi:hypothetical protein